MKPAQSKHVQQGMVLTKAICRLSEAFELTGKDLSDIIGVSESTMSRINQGKKQISPETKIGEMAILLIRIYRSLNVMVGHNHEKARRWLNSYNTYFQSKPIDTMKTISGLLAVLQYLDAMRGSA